MEMEKISIQEVPISKNLSEMAELESNKAMRPLSKSKNPLSAIGILFKKIVRKCTEFYIEPVCNQQTEYNMHNRACAEKLYNDIQMLKTETEKSNDEFQKQQMQIEKVDEKLSGDLDKLGITYEDRLNLIERKINFSSELIGEFAGAREQIKRCLDFYEKYGNVIMNIGESTDEKNSFYRQTVSQSGEDSILIYILNALQYDIKKVKYLDLGANHAKYLSNTYCLYKSGARGVLVEANPQLVPELNMFRSEDIVLNKCISDKPDLTMKFYIMNGDGLSTPDYKTAEDAMKKNQKLKIVDTVEVPSITINSIFKQYFVTPPEVVNIDIEGEEISILQTIDFNQIRPLIFVIETIPYSPQIVYGDKNLEIVKFMEDHHYTEYAFTGINSIFVDVEKLEKICV